MSLSASRLATPMGGRQASLAAHPIGHWVNDTTYGGKGCQVAGVLQNFGAAVGRTPPIALDYFNWTGGGWSSFPTSDCENARIAGCIIVLTVQPTGIVSTTFNSTTSTLNDIIAGNHDSAITTWAQQAKAWGHPFYFRFAHEMNGNWYLWGCEAGNTNGNTEAMYAAAWQHVHQLFEQAGCKNALFYWCPNVLQAGQTAADYAALYPGDTYVDAVGLDGYNKAVPPCVWQQSNGGNKTAQVTSTVSATAAFGSAFGNQDGVVVFCYSTNPNATVASVTDNGATHGGQAGTYISCGHVAKSSAGVLECWVASNLSASTTGVTVTVTWNNVGTPSANFFARTLNYSNVQGIDTANATFGTGTSAKADLTSTQYGNSCGVSAVFDAGTATSWSQPAASPLSYTFWAPRNSGNTVAGSYSIAEIPVTGVSSSNGGVPVTGFGFTCAASTTWHSLTLTLRSILGNTTGWKTWTKIFLASYAAITAMTSKPIFIGECACSELGGDRAAWMQSAFFTEIPQSFPQLRGITWFHADKTGESIVESNYKVTSSAASSAVYKQIVGSSAYHGPPSAHIN